jgi:hypothetical protein
MSKFIKNKSYLNELDNNEKKNIFDKIKISEYFLAIISLTILNSQCKKKNISIHGYYIGTIIELLIIMNREKNYMLYSLINITLSQQTEYLNNYLNKEKLIKMNTQAVKIINTRIMDIIGNYNFKLDNYFKRTDILKHNFGDNNDLIKNKIKNLKQIERLELENYILKTFGNICIISVYFAWIYGNGNSNRLSANIGGESQLLNKSSNKNIDLIEELGINISFLYKISYDYENLEKDIIEADMYSTNYVLNIGIQESFEKFMESKNRIIEICMKLDIYSNTMKEIIDLFENKLDIFIDKTDKDLKSLYTLSSK